MAANRKWLFVPPAAALLLLLGPLSMQGGTANAGRTERPAAETAAPAAATAPRQAAPAMPKLPDLWQAGATILGLGVLGGAGIWALRRYRQGGTTPGSTVVLRQTLRLSARQAVHAVEFDDQLLLVGEGERGLTLLHTGRAPDRAADEAEVLGRNVSATVGDDEDGAVPRDLVLQPAMPPASRPLPRPAATPARRPTLRDFRTLLQKAGKA